MPPVVEPGTPQVISVGWSTIFNAATPRPLRGCAWILARLEVAYSWAGFVRDVVTDAGLALLAADLPDHDAADLAGLRDVRSAARATACLE